MDREQFIDYYLRVVAEAAKEPEMERKLSRYEKTLQIDVSDLGAAFVIDTKGKTLQAWAGTAENPDDVITVDSRVWERILSSPMMVESAATSAAMGGELRFRGDMYAHMPLLGVLYSLAKAKEKLA